MKTTDWKRTARAALDAVPALLLAAMFLCFIIQVFMRYVVDSPVGWTVEVCVIAWLWVILWGQSASASEEDEIRFDIVYGSVSPGVRRWFRVVHAAAIVAIYAVSLPASWDLVTFMSIQETTYLDIPFSWVFSVLMLFLVVSILRYLHIFWKSLTGGSLPPSAAEAPAKTRKDVTE